MVWVAAWCVLRGVCCVCVPLYLYLLSRYLLSLSLPLYPSLSIPLSQYLPLYTPLSPSPSLHLSLSSPLPLLTSPSTPYQVCFLCREADPPHDPDWVGILSSICDAAGGVARAIALEEVLRSLPPPPPPPDPTDELAVMAYKMNPPPAPPPSVAACVALFLDKAQLAHATKLGLDALAFDPDALDAPLQTRLLQARLSSGVAVVRQTLIWQATPALAEPACPRALVACSPHRLSIPHPIPHPPSPS